MIHKKKKNTSKVNLTISTIVHAALVGALVFFAAKEGLLGNKMKKLTVTLVQKEKKPEPPKEKPQEPKTESPKPAESKPTPQAAPKVEQAATPPPANDSPVVAPAAAIVSDFNFGDGAKANQTISDPNGIYGSLVEHAMKSHWNRDDSIDDSQYVADVEVQVDTKGRITDTRWVSLSGNAKWDAAVKSAVAQTKALSRGPPKGFPSKFIVRFDVESIKSESLQISSSN